MNRDSRTEAAAKRRALWLRSDRGAPYSKRCHFPQNEHGAPPACGARCRHMLNRGSRPIQLRSQFLKLVQKRTSLNTALTILKLTVNTSKLKLRLGVQLNTGDYFTCTQRPKIKNIGLIIVFSRKLYVVRNFFARGFATSPPPLTVAPITIAALITTKFLNIYCPSIVSP